jgi:hypothetical protein
MEIQMSITPTEDERNPGSGTAQGLIDFLSWAIDNNYMNAATGGGIRTGVKKVLEAEPDLDTIDIRHADVPDILHRFHIRARGTMKDRSLDVYESRFRGAIEMYIKWLDKDKDWMPTSTRARKATTTGGAVKSQVQATNTTAVDVDEHTGLSGPSTPGVITYPFPIRVGLQGRITLPENLTRREADRISAFIKTLAMEDETVYEHSPRAISGVVMNDDQ